MAEQYQSLSAVYDSFMYDVSYGEWAAYINGFLQPRGGGRILEYACGTGSITLELLKLGYELTAVDISDSMLSEAAAKIGASPYSAEFVLADAAELRLSKPFDAIVCACDGLNYITGEDKLNRLFASAFHNLRPGGVFAFDISSEYKLSHVLGNDFFYDDADDGTLFWQNSYDEAARLATMDITLFKREGEVYQRFDEQHIQKGWRRQEIERIAGKNGFSSIDTYEFGLLTPPNKNVERLQFVAKKG